jgi:hypothetical protein
MNLGLIRGAGADRLNPVLESGPDHRVVIPAARP